MTQVILDFDVVGFHLWKDAPDEVSFLKDRHRHLFRIRVGYAVTDLDRELEIFMHERRLKAYLLLKYGNEKDECEFGQMSCEMIATDIMTAEKEIGITWCEVFEDNRGGARVEA